MKARQHPLLRLLANSRRYRGRLTLATSFSILNKLFDVMPPMLIGAAVDVVVRREESFLANLGIVEMHVQLLALCALTLFVWVMESLFDYIQHIYWRNLSQTISTTCAWKPMTMCSNWRWPGSRIAAPGACFQF